MFLVFELRLFSLAWFFSAGKYYIQLFLFLGYFFLSQRMINLQTCTVMFYWGKPFIAYFSS